MAKKSKIAHTRKQQELIEQYAEIRLPLKAVNDYEGLAMLAKNANLNRLKRRDSIDGRPRGYMQKFGISRIRFRELAFQGLIPG